MGKKKSWYNVKDLMELFGVTRNTIYNWIERGILPRTDQRIAGLSMKWRSSTVEKTNEKIKKIWKRKKEQKARAIRKANRAKIK